MADADNSVPNKTLVGRALSLRSMLLCTRVADACHYHGVIVSNEAQTSKSSCNPTQDAKITQSANGHVWRDGGSERLRSMHCPWARRVVAHVPHVSMK